jgi:hypothetical protein
MSYAPSDRATVARIVQVLEAQAWTVWWDPHTAEDQPLEVFLSDLDGEPLCVIAIWSKRAVHSRRLRRLAEEAERLGILVSARIDRVPLPLKLRFRGVEACDLARWRGEPDHPGLQALLTLVARKLETSADLTRVPRLSPPRRGRRARLGLNLKVTFALAALLALAIAALRWL